MIFISLCSCYLIFSFRESFLFKCFLRNSRKLSKYLMIFTAMKKTIKSISTSFLQLMWIEFCSQFLLGFCHCMNFLSTYQLWFRSLNNIFSSDMESGLCCRVQNASPEACAQCALPLCFLLLFVRRFRDTLLKKFRVWQMFHSLW